MSFKIDWHKLGTDQVRSWTEELIEDALNSGKRPSILASLIKIKDLNFGNQAPDFEVLEIGDLDTDRFRGIFKINYDGDFSLTLNTKVEGNPLNIYSQDLKRQEINNLSQSFVTPNFLLLSESFNLPLDLKLSDIKISGIGIIVFLRLKGLTLVFKNDPLDKIKVSSTFDTVQVLANFLQDQIEKQIRDLFRETLPTVIHQLSLKYLSKLNGLLDLHLSLLREGEDDRINFHEIEANSNENLVSVMRLFNARERLDLRIPKMKNVIQRLSLEKFNQNFAPTLLKLLKIDTSSTSNQNGIPIKLLEADYLDVNRTLDKISAIQTTNYYKTLHKRPKRRVIKLNSKKKTPEDKVSVQTPSTPRNQTVLVDMEPAGSGSGAFNMKKSMSLAIPPEPVKATATVMKPSKSANIYVRENSEFDNSGAHSSNHGVERSLDSPGGKIDTISIKQPKPVKPMKAAMAEEFMKMHLKELVIPPPSTPSPLLQLFSRGNTSPINTNSSLLSGVGLGNNYFNFTNSTDHSERDKLEEEFRRLLNFVNAKEVVKLQNLKRMEADELNRLSRKYGMFADVPPPYYL